MSIPFCQTKSSHQYGQPITFPGWIYVKSDFSISCCEWPWSYGHWIYNYLCNQCLSPLMRVWISIRARCRTLCDKVCQWLATGQWFSLGPPASSINKTDRHNIAEMLLKVALSTIKPNHLLLCASPNFILIQNLLTAGNINNIIFNRPIICFVCVQVF